MDNNKDVANLYEVESVPTILVFKNKNLIFQRNRVFKQRIFDGKSIKMTKCHIKFLNNDVLSL